MEEQIKIFFQTRRNPDYIDKILCLQGAIQLSMSDITHLMCLIHLTFYPLLRILTTIYSRHIHASLKRAQCNASSKYDSATLSTM